MLPNMADVLTDFEQTVVLRTVGTTTYDPTTLEPTVTTVDANIQAVVQVPTPDSLNAITVDTSLRYILIHTVSVVVNGNYLVYDNVVFKVISDGNWQDAGFYRAIGEQVKGDIV